MTEEEEYSTIAPHFANPPLICRQFMLQQESVRVLTKLPLSLQVLLCL